jgi:hypothetical protein
LTQQRQAHEIQQAHQQQSRTPTRSRPRRRRAAAS